MSQLRPKSIPTWALLTIGGNDDVVGDDDGDDVVVSGGMTQRCRGTTTDKRHFNDMTTFCLNERRYAKWRH